jgi:TolB protein
VTLVNLQRSVSFGLGILIGCQLTTGCAPTPPPISESDSAWIEEPQAKAPPAPTTTLKFESTQPPVPTETAQPAVTPHPQPAPRQHLIGLYGELVGTTDDAGAPYDGGNNLAQVSFATEGSCIDPDVDRTGSWVAFASTMHRKTADIYIKAVNGRTLTQITTDPADDVMPSFNPDGSSVAFASNRAGNWDIYTISTDGTQTVQITNDADHELHPSWSPDGKMIAYCKFGTQSMRWEIWMVQVDNPGLRHFLDYGVFPQWCPDPAHSKILFQRAKQRGSRDYSIWTIDVVNGQAMYPTEIVSAANAALINPAWSPDGSRIVFVAVIEPDQAPGARPSQSDLWVVNLDGSNRTSLTDGQFANFQPVWAGDGAVYFVSDRSGVDNIWAVATSRNTDMSKHQGGSIASADQASHESASHP